MDTLPIPTNNSRVGFHYFPDSMHYRDSDIQHWLPILKNLNCSWLILNTPQGRAIPESFISTLIANAIEPVLQFQMDPGSTPLQQDFNMLMDVYANWGVHYIVLFDRPNIRKSWSSASWAQQDLVERFLDRFIPLASNILQKGMIPVFPPLEPGGDYWDTTFLKSALESLTRRGQQSIIDNLVLSAYARVSEKGLNWGAGGPERWPGAKPYQASPDNEDQKGFHIFDWYEAIARTTLQKEVPILLLGVESSPLGVNESKGANQASSAALQSQNYVSIFQLLNKEKVSEPGSVQKSVNPVPDPILACSFWVLSADTRSKAISSAWFKSEGEPAPFVDAIIQWLDRRRTSTKSIKIHKDETSHPIAHYLLLPTYEWGVSDWHLEVSRPFIKKYAPTIGFSVSEAVLAAQVTVVGGPQTFSEEALDILRENGCAVERISGDGTSIATLLAER